MFFSSFFFCMCMFKLVDAETLVCAILLSCFVLTSPPSPSQCPLIERKTKCQIELSISSLVMLNYTALLGSTSGPSLYFFLESKFWGLSMGRWGMQGRSRAVRQLKDHPAGTGRIPGRERERERTYYRHTIPRKPISYFTISTWSSFQLFQIRKSISFLRRDLNEVIEMEKSLLTFYKGWSMESFPSRPFEEVGIKVSISGLISKS